MATAKLSPFQMQGCRVTQLSFEKHETADEQTEWRYDLKLNFDSDPFGDEETSKVARVGRLRVDLDWGEAVKGPFALSATIQAIFFHDGTLKDEDFQGLARARAAAILFAELRPAIGVLMMEAGEPFRLPLVHIDETFGRNASGEEE